MRADSPQDTFNPIPGQAADVSQVAFAPWVSRCLRQMCRGVFLVVLAFASYYLISHYILQSVRVVGSSMSPTLHDSESYLLNRWIYLARDPRVADVVVLRDPADGGFSVKRIVAHPGDTVYLKEGVLYVNGLELHESYLPPLTFTFSETRELLYKCGKHEYFVLGDNRNNSVDSRAYGPVPRKNILGMIIR